MTAGNVCAAAEGGLRTFDVFGRQAGTVPAAEPPTNLNWGKGFRGLYINRTHAGVSSAGQGARRLDV